VAGMGDSLLKQRMIELKNRRTLNQRDDFGAEIAVYDTDGDNIRHHNDEVVEVFSLELAEPNICIEQKYTDSEIATQVDNRRLYQGTEFNTRSKRHKTEKSLAVTGKTGNKAGERKIIDKDVFDENSVNVALSKDEFAIAVYEGRITISDTSWEKFRPEFEKIEHIITGWTTRHITSEETVETLSTS